MRGHTLTCTDTTRMNLQTHHTTRTHMQRHNTHEPPNTSHNTHEHIRLCKRNSYTSVEKKSYVSVQVIKMIC